MQSKLFIKDINVLKGIAALAEVSHHLNINHNMSKHTGVSIFSYMINNLYL